MNKGLNDWHLEIAQHGCLQRRKVAPIVTSTGMLATASRRDSIAAGTQETLAANGTHTTQPWMDVAANER